LPLLDFAEQIYDSGNELFRHRKLLQDGPSLAIFLGKRMSAVDEKGYSAPLKPLVEGSALIISDRMGEDGDREPVMLDENKGLSKALVVVIGAPVSAKADSISSAIKSHPRRQLLISLAEASVPSSAGWSSCLQAGPLSSAPSPEE
jgi:hypothetical protein